MFKSSFGVGTAGARRSVVAVCLAICTLAALLAVTSNTAAAQPGVVPTQWIAKQFTELLGRAPTPSEWNSWSAYYDANGCNADSLKAKSRALALGSEFASRYGSSAKAARVVALTRAVYNHEPNSNDWAGSAGYRAGSSSWMQQVDATFNLVWAAWVVPSICSASEPGYGFGASIPLDVRALSGLGTSRTAATLQSQLDAAAESCGTVALAEMEVVLVGDNAALRVPPCVALTTAGAPSVRSYARQGRIVGVGAQCVAFFCADTAVVSLGRGAELRNVWVDALNVLDDQKTSAVQLAGSTAADPGVIDDTRISDPGAGGNGIRVLGFGVTGEACDGALITENLITGYARAHALDRAARAQWADGIEVHCENAAVERNDIVDVGDWGIGLHGVWNRTGGLATQQSDVRGNRVLSAGTSGSVAIGIDPAGLCQPDRPFLPVPCIDNNALRSFAGSIVEDNQFWTGSRTSFDIGLMVGGKPLWGDHAAYGSGVTVRNNTTGGIAARVNVGIAVSGMYDTTLTGNTPTYTLVDSIGDAGGDLAGCPLVNVGDTRPWLASFTAGSQNSTTAGLYGCLLDPFPTGGLERIVTTTAGGGSFVGASTGRAFTPWGHNYNPKVGYTDDDWTDESTMREIIADFSELKQMGTNTLRITFQLNRFMLDPATPNPDAFARLNRLAVAAEKLGIYLDITGLGAHREADNNIPDTQPGVADADDWLSSPDEAMRWNAQAVFWEEAARTLKDRTSVLLFNLMNEMVTTNANGWCVSPDSDFCFVQAIARSLDPDGPTGPLPARNARDLIRSWVEQMRSAIEVGEGRLRTDPDHRITASNLLFTYSQYTGDLDDVTLHHAYVPHDDVSTPANEVTTYITNVKAKKVAGKPMIIEEFFYSLAPSGPNGCPLFDAACNYEVSQASLEAAVYGTQPEANGWFGHATGHTLAEGHPNFMFAWWLQFFERNTPVVAPCRSCQP